jgi:hypothetical protein
MTLIQRSAFTNVANTGTTFDNVFTSTYNVFLVIIENTFSVSSATADMQMELLYSGSVESAGYYAANPWAAYDSSTFNNYGTNNAAQLNLVEDMGIGVNSAATAALYFYNIGTGGTSQPQITGVLQNAYAGRSHCFAGLAVTSRSYTGFRLKANTANITGAIAVYGLAK